MGDTQNEESVPYDKEKESFLKDLQDFHEKRGTPFRDGPKIGGRPVDLHRLYGLVTSEGGWVKVNSRNDWDKVLEELKLPVDCVNCCVAVKQVYLRYLDRYEELYFFGEIEERGAGDDDEDSRSRKLTMRSLNAFPHNYNHMQHCVNESLRECNGLSIDLYQPSEYDKLALSLISPLANEQDFAINVCTLISQEGKHCLKLLKHPRILYFLLGHAAVFNHSTLRQIFTEHYSKGRGYSVNKFWHDIVEDSRLVRLIDETRFEVNEYEDDLTGDCLITSQGSLSFRPEDGQLFCIGRTLGTQEFIGQRVIQIATILRNLTFVPENLTLMCSDLTLLRFMLLCCGSNWNSLRQIGWDMLGNVAQDITIICPLMPEILDLTVQGLESSDRAQILSSLEVLNKLSQNDKNEDYFLKYLKIKVYDKICSFLSVQDIMMLIYTLECLYSLSSMGEKACDAIVRVHGALDTLVSLVTVEAQSYGPKACIQMKVVETVTGVAGVAVQNGTASTTQTSAPNQTLQTSTQTVTVASSVQVHQLSNVPPPSPRPQLMALHPQPIHPSSPGVTQPQISVQSPSKVAQTQVTHINPTSKIVQVVHSSPSQGPTTHSQVVHLSPAMTKVVQAQVAASVQSQVTSTQQFQMTQTQVQISQPQSSMQVQGTSQVSTVQSRVSAAPASSSVSSPQQVVQENERFVLLWLRNTFEPYPGCRIEQHELYKKYIEYCVKIGRRGVIAPIHFHRYVKSVFGSNVGPVTITSGSGDASQEYFEGIRMRLDVINTPNPMNQVAQTLSPLLKAQLSAPLKPTATTQNKIIHRQQQQQIIIQQSPESRQTICPSPTQSQQIHSAPSKTPPPSVLNSVIAHSGSPPPVMTLTPTTTLQSSPNVQSSPPVLHSSSSSVLPVQSPTLSSVATGTTLPIQGSSNMLVSTSSNISMVTQSSVSTVPPSMVSTVSVPVQNTSSINSTSLSQPSSSTLQVPTPNASGIEKSSECLVKTEPQDNKEGNDQLNGLQSKEINIREIKIEEMAIDTLVTSSSGDSASTENPPTSGTSSICVKASPSLKDHEYISNTASAGVAEIKSEPMSTENSSDSNMVNGLSKATEAEENSNKDLLPKKLTTGMLADLLEKNVDKIEPPSTNCSLRIGEKGLELIPGPDKEKSIGVPSHSIVSTSSGNSLIIVKEEVNPLKRPGEEVDRVETKKICVNVNGIPTLIKEEDTPEEGNVSSSAANLYAALAADALEDEPVEETPKPPVIVTAVNQPRQILLTTGSQIAQSVIVSGQHYIVAQPQTLVQGQPQTVLVAQASQPQGLGAKTIIFLQPQNMQGGSGQQKVLVQTANPPPLIATSQASPMLRPKTSNSPSQTSSLLQQAILRQNLNKTLQAQSNIVSQSSPQKHLIQQTGVVQQHQATTTSVTQQQNTGAPGGGQQQGCAPSGAIQQQAPSQQSSPLPQQSSISQVTPVKLETPVSTTQLNVSKLPGTLPTLSRPSSPQVVQQITNVNLTPNPHVQQLATSSTPTLTKPSEKGRFLCEWRGCMRSFRSAGEVYIHACEAHCPDTPKDIQCLWQRCDTMKRKRFSHMTHLYNRHCNPEVMRLAAERSKQLSAQGRTEIPAPSPPMPHPGYAPNAALLAINRHASDYVNPKELQDENEGPVTKSIRLTSALILRNLVIFSSSGRRHLSRFEPHLANIALSGVESSRTIAHVLYDMSENLWHHIST